MRRPVGVVMIVVMPCAMCVVMRVCVIMAMIVAHGAPKTIGPAFGHKRRGNFGNLCAKARKHFGQHMIMPDQQPVAIDLAGCVAVSDMPGQPRQISAGDGQQRFMRGPNRYGAAICQQQGIAGRKVCCFRQVQQQKSTLIGGQALSAQETRIIAEGNTADGRRLACPRDFKNSAQIFAHRFPRKSQRTLPKPCHKEKAGCTIIWANRPFS